MNPDPAPLSAARNAGSPLTSGFTSRSMRRSDMAASSASAMPKASAHNPRLAPDGVGFRQRARRFHRAHHHGIVGHGCELGVHRGGGVCELLAHRAVHLRNGAQTQGILGARAGARGENRAAGEERSQALSDARLRRSGAQRQDFGIERGNLAAQILERHGGNLIRPVEQPLDARERERRQAGGAGRAVDQAQSFLGLERQGLEAGSRERLGAAAAAHP